MVDMSKSNGLDFKKIFYESPVAIFVCEANDKWTVLRANEFFYGAVNLTEQKFAEKYGRSFLRLLQKESRPALLEKFRQYMEDYKKSDAHLPFYAEAPVRIDSGTFIPIQIAVTYSPEDNPLLYCVVTPSYDEVAPLFDAEDTVVDKVKEGLAQEKNFQDNNAELFAGKKILLAEEHPLNLKMTSKMLARIGFDVVTAPGGKQALEKYQAEGPESFFAILMDHKMPMMDGEEVAHEIRNRESDFDPKDKSILFVLVNPADHKSEDGHRYDCFDDHLVKPFSIVKLIEKLSDYL